MFKMFKSASPEMIKQMAALYQATEVCSPHVDVMIDAHRIGEFSVRNMDMDAIKDFYKCRKLIREADAGISVASVEMILSKLVRAMVLICTVSEKLLKDAHGKQMIKDLYETNHGISIEDHGNSMRAMVIDIKKRLTGVN